MRKKKIEESNEPKKFIVYEYISMPGKGSRFWKENDGKDYTKNHTGVEVCKIVLETNLKKDAVNFCKQTGDAPPWSEVQSYYQNMYPGRTLSR